MHFPDEILQKWCCVFLRLSYLEAHDVHLSLTGDINFDHTVPLLPGFSILYLLFFPATNKKSVGQHLKIIK